MSQEGWHLAQVNVARLLSPLDSPQLAGFVEMLEPINAVADASPGFVWRLQTEAGDATAIRIGGDDRIIVNLSVWTSLAALERFVFASRHAEVLRRRREWFARMAEAYVAMWWLPRGRIPTVPEAEQRLEHIRAHGPSPHAFTLRMPFGPSEAHDDRADAIARREPS